MSPSKFSMFFSSLLFLLATFFNQFSFLLCSHYHNTFDEIHKIHKKIRNKIPFPCPQGVLGTFVIAWWKLYGLGHRNLSYFTEKKMLWRNCDAGVNVTCDGTGPSKWVRHRVKMLGSEGRGTQAQTTFKSRVLLKIPKLRFLRVRNFF